MTKTLQKIYPINLMRNKKAMWNYPGKNLNPTVIELGVAVGNLSGYLKADDQYGNDIVYLKGDVTVKTYESDILMSKVLVIPMHAEDISYALLEMLNTFDKNKLLKSKNIIRYKITINAEYKLKCFNKYQIAYNLETKTLIPNVDTEF